MRMIGRSKYLLVLCLLVSLVGCGGGSEEGKQTTEDNKSTTLVGVASKGPINGATVTVFPLSDAGIKGDQFANSATTATDGGFSIDIGAYTGNVLLEVVGGTYTDEASNTMVENASTFRAVFANVSGTINVNATAFTEMAVRWAAAKGGLTTDNINAANLRLSTLIGVNIHTTRPADVLATNASEQSDAAQAYGVALAGISQFNADYGDTFTIDIVINILAEDLIDNNQLDTVDIAYIGAINSFFRGEHNRSNPAASSLLLESIGSPPPGDVGGTSFVDRLAGSWYLVEFDDMVHGDGSLDNYAEETNGPVTIQINEDGSLLWRDDFGDITYPNSSISIDESSLSATIEVITGVARIILTYEHASSAIKGRLQILAADGVTYYENYETFIMVAPQTCSAIGSPHSYGGYMSSTEDCGTPTPFTEGDLIGNTFYFSDVPNQKYIFTSGNTGFHATDNIVDESFTWYVDGKGYLEIGFSSSPIRKRIAWMGNDAVTGDILTRIYTEDETRLPSDLILDAKADGEISESAMVLTTPPPPP